MSFTFWSDQVNCPSHNLDSFNYVLLMLSTFFLYSLYFVNKVWIESDSTYITIFTVNAVYFKLHHIRRHMMSGCSNTTDTNFVYWGVSADSYISYLRYIFPPLQLQKKICELTLWYYIHILFKYSQILSLNKISILWWFSSKLIISRRGCLLVFYY